MEIEQQPEQPLEYIYRCVSDVDFRSIVTKGYISSVNRSKWDGIQPIINIDNPGTYQLNPPAFCQFISFADIRNYHDKNHQTLSSEEQYLHHSFCDKKKLIRIDIRNLINDDSIITAPTNDTNNIKIYNKSPIVKFYQNINEVNMNNDPRTQQYKYLGNKIFVPYKFIDPNGSDTIYLYDFTNLDKSIQWLFESSYGSIYDRELHKINEETHNNINIENINMLKRKETSQSLIRRYRVTGVSNIGALDDNEYVNYMTNELSKFYPIIKINKDDQVFKQKLTDYFTANHQLYTDQNNIKLLINNPEMVRDLFFPELDMVDFERTTQTFSTRSIEFMKRNISGQSTFRQKFSAGLNVKEYIVVCNKIPINLITVYDTDIKQFVPLIDKPMTVNEYGPPDDCYIEIEDPQRGGQYKKKYIEHKKLYLI